MIYLLYAVHVIVCVFLILVVLLQQGKGADLSVFGGGSTQTAFGARGTTTLLHKLTVTSFVIFILTTLSIAVFQGGGRGSSVMSDYMKEQAREETTPKPIQRSRTPAERVPGTPAPVAPTAPAPPAPPAGPPPGQPR